jgi:hypothetical protein
MRNYFIGWSQSDLEAELRTAQKELAGGAQLTGGNAGDQSFTQEGRVKLEDRIANLYYALNKLDAAKYPAADCNPTTRTQAVFRDCH